MLNSRISKTLTAAAFASLAIAAPASADSFVYLKGGDVFLTTTDASRQFQVTESGVYTYVSQADDGTILATTISGHLRRMDRQGQILSDITTPVTGADNGPFRFKGPYDADLSPNGLKAAYGFLYTGYTNTTDGTYVNDGSATGFTRSDSPTSITENGYKWSREYDSPEWIDNERVLVSNGPGWPSSPFAIVQAGSGDSRSWFYDPNNMHPHDATLSRNSRYIAAANSDRSRLHVYRDDDAQPMGGVHDCFYYSDNRAVRYSSPTFNGDGTLLAWANGRGLEIAPISGALRNGNCPDGLNSREVLPGASSPDWGPAGVPTVRTTPVPTPTPTSAPTYQPQPTNQPQPTTQPQPTQQPQPTPQPQPTTQPQPTKQPQSTIQPTPVRNSGGDQGSGQGSEARNQTGRLDAGGNVAQAETSALRITVPAIKLGKAVKGGLPVAVQAPAAGSIVVTVTSKSGKVVASGTTTTKTAGATTVSVKFTPAAKRKLGKLGGTTVTVAATQGNARASIVVTLKK